MALSAVQEEIVAKFVWLGQKLGLVSKPKADDDADTVAGGGSQPAAAAAASAAEASQPPATLPPARPVGSFNAATAKPMMPMYATTGSMYPRYGAGATGATKVTSLKPGQDSPLTKRAAAVIASASGSDNKR